MGIWSPDAYDELLLSKVKTLLGAVLNQPKRNGTRVSYEQFVKDLDVNHKTNLAAMEKIVYETTVRMRRPARTTNASISTAHAPQASTSANSTRRLASSSSNNLANHTDGATRIGSRSWRLNGRRMLALSDTTSESSSDDDVEYQPVTNDDGAGFGEQQPHDQPTVSRLLRMQVERERRREAAAEDHVVEGGDHVVEGGDSAVVASTSEANSQRNLRRAIDYLRADSDAARSRVMDDLFGYEDNRPTFTPSSIRANRTNHPLAIHTIPILPTFQELWSILLDDTPYPSESITSLPDLVRAINASPFSTTQLLADDLRALCTELVERDPTIAIRIGNVVRNRNPASRARSGAREGNPRDLTSLFHEHFPDEGEEEGMGPGGEFEFSSFARERRAHRRAERDRAEGAGAAPREGAGEQDGADGAAMEFEAPVDVDEGLGAESFDAAQARTLRESRRAAVDRQLQALRDEMPSLAALPSNVDDNSGASLGTSAAPSTSADTPHSHLATDDTPASSLAQSPAAPASPPTTTIAASGSEQPLNLAPLSRPLTSAAIAEAAQIARRRIAPLPSSTSSSASGTPTGGSGAPRAQRASASVFGLVPEDGQPRTTTRINLGAMLRAGWDM
ncbi:hypothetical protein BCR35DRAFT_355199 [Leucosporidium creatinivorum]|uniref:Uncharacterized protein n=1 Tax=Leucosporidium creatinivorum TaxID=106004 RepID=A0A1Y2DPG4_9BASI|nr:hypothetical protein BCR35DRAFT_355199 [Leucosporidium creatinivorum]